MWLSSIWALSFVALTLSKFGHPCTRRWNWARRWSASVQAGKILKSNWVGSRAAWIQVSYHPKAINKMKRLWMEGMLRWVWVADWQLRSAPTGNCDRRNNDSCELITRGKIPTITDNPADKCIALDSAANSPNPKETWLLAAFQAT